MLENLTNEDVPVDKLDRKVKRLKNKCVASVKVLWWNQEVKSATLEAEPDMKKQYPYVFQHNEA